MKNDMYIGKPMGKRRPGRRRRRRSRAKQLAIRAAIIIAFLLVLSLLVGGIFVLASKVIKHNPKKNGNVQKVTLVNLDDVNNLTSHKKPSGGSGEPVTEKPKEEPTEAPTEAPTRPIETAPVPEVNGSFVYFYGNKPDDIQANVASYSDEPYQGTVKDGFKPLNQIYRTPTAESFTDDGFFTGTLFVGDSITTGISIFNQDYGYNITANVLADKGYTIGKIMLRKDEIVSYNPSRIFILVGSNDLNSSAPNIENIASRYISAIKELQNSLPSAKIYIMLTLPINTKYEEKASIRNDKITEFDKKVVELCNQNGIYYIDMATSLKGEDGMLIPDLTDDGLHLKGKYYGYWYNIIRDIIRVNEGLN